MLGCTNVTLIMRWPSGWLLSSRNPKLKQTATTSIGIKISPIQIDLAVGRRITINPAESSASEVQVTRNETPYTPVTVAICASGNRRYCETPSRSQGKPPIMRANTISHPTQPAAAQKAHNVRAVQLFDNTP